jgi:hypothetical protein
LYPHATVELIALDDGFPLFVRIDVPAADVAARHGLVLRAVGRDGQSEERVVATVGPTGDDLASATWEGVIRLDHGGRYELGGDGLRVHVDDLAFDGAHYLGRGLYRLRVETRGDVAPDALRWRLDGRDLGPVPANALFLASDERQGLLAQYWTGTEWEGDPVFEQVVPFLRLSWPDEAPLVPVQPFSARYTATLHVESGGERSFMLDADDDARLILDGEVVADATTGSPGEGTRLLAPGDHQIQVDYVQRGGGSTLRLYWARPGEPFELVPPTVMRPG